MDLYACIKKIYPNILNIDFRLQDDSDGKGAYIRFWNYYQPQPTQAEMEAVYPQVLREQKIKELKRLGQEVIYLKSPAFKQANVGMGIYDTATSAPIVNWVKAVRQAVQEIEDRVNLAVSLTEVEDVSFDFNLLKARTEEIFKTL